MRKWIKVVLPASLLFIFVAALLEVAVAAHWLDANLFPKPSDVFKALVEHRETLTGALIETISHALMGLGISLLLGLSLALILALYPWLRQAVTPYTVFFQTVPIIAIAPILVIWFGFGATTVVTCAVIVSLFPVITSTLEGLDGDDPQFRELFSLYNSSKWDLYVKLKFPQSIPSVITGTKIASGLAIIGTIVGEFIAGGGLGSLIDSARTQQRIDLVFAAVFLSTIIGLVLVLVLEWAPRMLFHKYLKS